MTDTPKPGETVAPAEAAEAAVTEPADETVAEAGAVQPARARPERRGDHDQRPAGHGAQGRADHRRRRAPRRVHPALLLAQPDELGRHVPHVPRRGRQRPRPAAHAVVHGHGRPGHEGRHRVGDDEAGPGGHPRAAARQPPARLPGVRQGRRVPAAGPGVQPRSRREPLRRGEAALREADPDQRPRPARPRALHPVRPLHPLRRRGRRRPADQLHPPRQPDPGADVPRRAVRVVLLGQHRADLPGRRADGRRRTASRPGRGTSSRSRARARRARSAAASSCSRAATSSCATSASTPTRSTGAGCATAAGSTSRPSNCRRPPRRAARARRGRARRRRRGTSR